MYPNMTIWAADLSHLLWGRCGLKWGQQGSFETGKNVTFCEEGVDWNRTACGQCPAGGLSPSVRKVWIEISHPLPLPHPPTVTFCEEGVDWNVYVIPHCLLVHPSPSVRKVWIEISAWLPSIRHALVTFCEEGVDWNMLNRGKEPKRRGHLLWGRCGLKYCRPDDTGASGELSPSVRKVWIEMLVWKGGIQWKKVTFCEEGVDWNYTAVLFPYRCHSSPSVRKVWIEMLMPYSPLAKSHSHLLWGRCGLKYYCVWLWRCRGWVTFCEEGVDWNILARRTFSGRLSSPSVRKVWIEIRRKMECACGIPSPSVRKVWIEMEPKSPRKYRLCASPSVRKVWIEIAPSVDLHWILTQF